MSIVNSPSEKPSKVGKVARKLDFDKEDEAKQDSREEPKLNFLRNRREPEKTDIESGAAVMKQKKKRHGGTPTPDWSRRPYPGKKPHTGFQTVKIF